MNTLLLSSRIPISRLWFALAGVMMLCATIRAEEKPNNLLTSLSSTTISGYVDYSAHWDIGAANSIPEPATGTLLFAGAAVLVLFNSVQRPRIPASSDPRCCLLSAPVQGR
jgi:hypothetical protein